MVGPWVWIYLGLGELWGVGAIVTGLGAGSWCWIQRERPR